MLTTQRKALASLLVVASLLTPLSAFAETRRTTRTDMNQVARELQRVLGQGSVVRRTTTTSAPATHEVIEEQVLHAPGPVDEASLIAAMNDYRAEHGLPPLRANRTLARAAEDRMNDMFMKRYFSHVSPDGIQPHTWVEKRGYDFRLFGENLASGYSNAREVVDGWMRSPGHRANVLGQFDEVGVSVVEGAPVSRYRGGFTFVALYARSM